MKVNQNIISLNEILYDSEVFRPKYCLKFRRKKQILTIMKM